MGYSRTIQYVENTQDNLTSSSATDPLSANQGKLLLSVFNELNAPISEVIPADSDTVAIISIPSTGGSDAIFNIDFDVTNTGLTSGQFSISNDPGATSSYGAILTYNKTNIAGQQTTVTGKYTVNPTDTFYLSSDSTTPGTIDNALNLVNDNDFAEIKLIINFSASQKLFYNFTATRDGADIVMVGIFNFHPLAS